MHVLAYTQLGHVAVVKKKFASQSPLPCMDLGVCVRVGGLEGEGGVGYDV